MKKQPEPNLQLLLKSAISALQITFKNYKTAIIKDLEVSWYSDNGDFTCLAGSEKRKKKIIDLEKEVIRLQIEVDEIKNKIKAKEQSNSQKSEG